MGFKKKHKEVHLKFEKNIKNNLGSRLRIEATQIKQR